MTAQAEAKLSALAELSQLLGAKLDLDSRISRAFTYLAERLGYEHSMLLVPADTPDSLVMLASYGYAAGVGAQVVDTIQREVFDELDAPIIRVTGADVPMPYNKFLERAAKVDPGKIVAAVNQVLYREDEA